MTVLKWMKSKNKEFGSNCVSKIGILKVEFGDLFRRFKNGG